MLAYFFFKRVFMKILLAPIALLLAGQVCAQSADTRSMISTKSSSTGVILTLTDKDGKPFAFGSSDVEGNPFFSENWSRVNLRLTNGSVYKNIKARLNIYDNYLHFMNSKGAEMYLEAGEITRVELLDSVKTDSVRLSFVRMTVTEGVKEVPYFYKVLADGKVMLLERLRKRIKENKYLYSGEIKRFYEQYEDYYVFANNELMFLKRKESFWQPIMTDKWTAVQDYTGRNDIGFKSLDNIEKIVKYYNALF
jgi:hypothetical protein